MSCCFAPPTPSMDGPTHAFSGRTWRGLGSLGSTRGTSTSRTYSTSCAPIPTAQGPNDADIASLFAIPRKRGSPCERNVNGQGRGSGSAPRHLEEQPQEQRAIQNHTNRDDAPYGRVRPPERHIEHGKPRPDRAFLLLLVAASRACCRRPGRSATPSCRPSSGSATPFPTGPSHAKTRAVRGRTRYCTCNYQLPGVASNVRPRH